MKHSLFKKFLIKVTNHVKKLIRSDYAESNHRDAEISPMNGD